MDLLTAISGAFTFLGVVYILFGIIGIFYNYYIAIIGVTYTYRQYGFKYTSKIISKKLAKILFIVVGLTLIIAVISVLIFGQDTGGFIAALFLLFLAILWHAKHAFKFWIVINDRYLSK